MHAALGLTREQYARREAEVRRGGLNTVRATVPEDCVSWIEGGLRAAARVKLGG